MKLSWKFRFFTFWSAQAVSLFGSGLASFALVWWITETTGSATALATSALAAMLPGILIGPLAGALVDRLDRKWVIIIADSTSALMALLLVVLFWTDVIQLWHIYAINAVRGAAGAFQFPAVQSSTSLMVPREQLARVAGLNQALQGATMIATPALGALLLGLLPLHNILGLDVISAVIAIGLLFLIPIPRQEVKPAAAGAARVVWQDLRAGVTFLMRWPALLSVIGIASLLNLVLTPAFSLVPILVMRHFLGEAPQLAAINAAYGLGFVAGGVLLGVWGGFPRRVHTSLFGLAGLGAGALLIGMAPFSAFWLGLTGMALIGFMNPLANGPFFAILQDVVPPAMQGRVFTVLMSISLGMSPLGLALAGPLADRFGVQIWYVLAALICLLMVVWIALSPALLHLEEARQPDLPEQPVFETAKKMSVQ